MENKEQIIIDNAKSGSREAQKSIYEAYAGQLMAIAMRYIGNREDAEDVLHDSFIKAFKSIDRFNYRGEGSLKAWLKKLTVNTALEWLRNKNKHLTTSLDDRASQIEVVDQTSYSQVQTIPREVLMKFVSELPDGYRAVFNLFCIEDYSHREIAQMLGINEKSSSSQLLRAKRLLSTKVKEYIRSHE